MFAFADSCKLAVGVLGNIITRHPGLLQWYMFAQKVPYLFGTISQSNLCKQFTKRVKGMLH